MCHNSSCTIKKGQPHSHIVRWKVYKFLSNPGSSSFAIIELIESHSAAWACIDQPAYEFDITCTIQNKDTKYTDVYVIESILFWLFITIQKLLTHQSMGLNMWAHPPSPVYKRRRCHLVQRPLATFLRIIYAQPSLCPSQSCMIHYKNSLSCQNYRIWIILDNSHAAEITIFFAFSYMII